MEEAGTDRGSATLGRPIIVGVDRKTRRVHAHQVKVQKAAAIPGLLQELQRTLRSWAAGGQEWSRRQIKKWPYADVQRQVVAVRSGETVPTNSPVGESQSNGRVEIAVQGVQGLMRTFKDALERRLNTRIKSSDAIFPWMVEWSAGLITRCVKGQTGEVRGHDAQAPVAEFGEKIMYMTSKNTSKSAPKADAKFHAGVENEERRDTEWSNKAKTVRRLPEEQRWCAEVMSIRGVPSNPVPGVGGDHIPNEVGGSAC